MSDCGKYPYEDPARLEAGKYASPAGENLNLVAPRYTCAVHGDVLGQHVFVSTIPGHEMHLCLKCFLEKLKEIGVCELKVNY